MGGRVPPLLVAGVAGGVGTSTFVRILRLAAPHPVEDLGKYRGGPVHVLVTANIPSAAQGLEYALPLCPLPPVLIVMHTVAGVIKESDPFLIKAEPHITARLDIDHRWTWQRMTGAPGEQLPHRAKDAKDIASALRALPPALNAMLAQPPPVVAPPHPGNSAHATIAARAGPLHQRPQQRFPAPHGTDSNVVFRGHL